MSDYRYLFPFEKVPQGSDVLIYGAGRVGKEYVRQLLITKYARIVGLVDRKYQDIHGMPVRVWSPMEIPALSFDFVVLAFQSGGHYKSVIASLLDLGVAEDRIVYIPARNESCISDNFFSNEGNVAVHDFAWQHSRPSVAVLLNSSLGDNIVRKKIIEAMVQIEPHVYIDIYSPIARDWLPWLYHDCSNIHAFIPDSGGLYSEQARNYHVAITIANFIQLDHLSLEPIMEKFPFFCQRMELLKKRTQEAEVDFSMPFYTFFARALKQGKNYYTVYGYDGVFDICDQKISLELDPQYQGAYDALSLSPGGYITVNYGNAISMEHEGLAAKQWPAAYFEEWIRMFHREYPHVQIVQLGAENAGRLKGANAYVLGQRMELAAHILKHSLLHVDIEGGLVHLATQLGTKCVVLFGPTQEGYFGYPQNINIKAGTCHDCCGMYLDINACARHQTRPECMWRITPEMVLARVKEYVAAYMLRSE